MSAPSQDPYVYPGSNTLRNLRDIRDFKELEGFERRHVVARNIELDRNPMAGNFDAAHLKAIHNYLFQDVYAWAGQFRTTDLRKQNSAFSFVPRLAVEAEARRMSNGLRGKNFLKGLSRQDFAREAARVFTQLNNTHPFREGNGRTQRVFLSQLAAEAGHMLHFDVVSEERMVLASIAGHTGDISMTTRLFEEITDSARVRPLRRAVTFLGQSGYEWNQCYIATTTPGQSYTGTFVGRDNDAFMMRTNTKLFVGHSVDLPAQVSQGSPVSFRATTAPGHTPAQQLDTAGRTLPSSGNTQQQARTIGNRPARQPGEDEGFGQG